MEHLKTVTNEFLGINLNFYTHNGELWFRAFEIATILKYKKGEKSSNTIFLTMKVKKNILLSNDSTMETQVMMVSEPGLYRLIYLSDYKHKKLFKRWLYRAILPSLREEIKK